MLKAVESIYHFYYSAVKRSVVTKAKSGIFCWSQTFLPLHYQLQIQQSWGEPVGNGEYIV